MPLINCPACAREISDAAPSCPGCGHPLRAVAPQVVQIAAPPPTKQPSMAESFAAGFIGGTIRVVGVLIALVGFISDVKDGVGWIILAIVAIVFGSYMKYTSAHTVRTAR
jgi:hypothetical protein